MTGTVQDVSADQPDLHRAVCAWCESDDPVAVMLRRASSALAARELGSAEIWLHSARLGVGVHEIAFKGMIAKEEAAYREGFADAERAMDERHWDYVRGNVIAGIVAAMQAPVDRAYSPRSDAPWRIMTLEEYRALIIRGPYQVERHDDGTVSVWLYGVPAQR